MEYEQKNNLDMFDYYLELFSQTDGLAQDNCTSCKTLSSESGLGFSEAIEQLRKVKIGRRRDFKLMKENIDSLKHVVPENRRLSKKQSIALTCEMDDPKLTTQTTRKHKLIYKKLTKSIKHRRREVDNATQSRKKSQFSEEESKKQNYEQKQNIIRVSSKGANLSRNIAQGLTGHSTLLFSHEIVEGAYYLQIKVVNCAQESDNNNKPDIRIGVCTKNHKLDTPLGYKNSIGFSLTRKNIITEGRKFPLTEESQQLQKADIKSGDVIGMLVDFSPPYKCPNPLKNWEQSSLTFYLNGQQIGKYTQLKQIFYRPAISLYNQAKIEICTKAEQMRFMPKHCLAYEEISKYKNIYT